jgi:hypothetical protein
MTLSMKVHCCACEGPCYHTAGPYYCDMHNPYRTPSQQGIYYYDYGAMFQQILVELQEIKELLKKC